VKRLVVLLILVLGAIAGAVPLAGARRAHSSLFHSVEVRQSALGKILENSAGSVLYEFTADKPKKDRCVAIKGCTAVWTPQPAGSGLSAGPGAKRSLLSSIAIAGGVRQLTYAGHPLYLYTPRPTGTRYVGASQFGGHWYAINAKGAAVK
jgi:predicted lipoprotein with Yx(FWY)xxD motif